MQKYGKTAVYPGGYRLDWGNTTRAAFIKAFNIMSLTVCLVAEPA